MKKGLSYLNSVPVVLLCLLGLFTGLSWFWDRRVFFGCLTVFVLALAFTLIHMARIRKELFRYLQKMCIRDRCSTAWFSNFVVMICFFP